MRNTKLAAIHIERRSAAIAIFTGTQLAHAEVKRLDLDQSAAERKLIGFIRKMLAQFEIDRVVLQALPLDATVRARAVHAALTSSLREAAVSIWNIPQATIMNAFGVPPLTSRSQLHKSIGQIWPSLKSLYNNRVALRAAAVGLYFQAEHILSLATQPE